MALPFPKQGSAGATRALWPLFVTLWAGSRRGTQTASFYFQKTTVKHFIIQQFFFSNIRECHAFGRGYRGFFRRVFCNRERIFEIELYFARRHPLTENIIFSKFLSHSYQRNFTGDTQAINQRISLATIPLQKQGANELK